MTAVDRTQLRSARFGVVLPNASPLELRGRLVLRPEEPIKFAAWVGLASWKTGHHATLAFH